MNAIAKGMFGYLFLVFIVRIAGRRPGKQVAPFEYILIFFMGGLALTALVGNDRSLISALCVVMGVALSHLTISVLCQKSRRIAAIVEGTPLVLIRDGCFQIEVMKNLRIGDDDIMAAARDKGIKTLEQIEYAVVERNGEISIISRSSESDR